MLHSCSIYHICVLSLSIVQFTLISLTYLDLIKLMIMSCGFCTWFSVVWLFFCRCLAVPLEEKTLSLMFHHPLFQNGLAIQLKTQTVKDSGLLLIHNLIQASLKMLLLLWNEWSNLITRSTTVGAFWKMLECVCESRRVLNLSLFESWVEWWVCFETGDDGTSMTVSFPWEEWGDICKRTIILQRTTCKSHKTQTLTWLDPSKLMK